MIDIDMIKNEIVERLKPLDPDKIILFGSYAYGTPNEESDIDLFLMTDESKENIEAKALFSLRELTRKYRVGFDIVSDTTKSVLERKEPFYSIEIMEKGKVIYGK